MIRTLRTEMRRALARRITRGLVLFAVLGIVVVGVITLLTADTKEQLDAGHEREVAAMIDQCVRDPYRWEQGGMVEELQDDGSVLLVPADTDGPAPEDLSEGERRDRCEADIAGWYGQPEVFQLRHLWDPDNEEGLLLLPATLLLICALGAGASMIGGEWKANTVTTLLVWEPRRTRLLGSRMLASFLLASAISLGLLLLFSGAFWPTAALKGSTAGMDSAWWTSYLHAMARISLMAGAAAVLGVALASIARSTAGGVMTIFLWIAVGESIVAAIRPGLTTWLISLNLGVLTIAEEIVEDDLVLTVGDAAMRLGAYLGIAVVVALLLFERRDVAG